jgi:hypothetical protein
VLDWSKKRKTEAQLSLLGAALYKDIDTFYDQLSKTREELAKISTQAKHLDWQFKTLTDAYSPRKPVEYAVDGLFAMPSLSLVYGAPGSLKSFLLIDMALCVASGIPWLPPIPTVNDTAPRATTLMPVVWLDFDNGERRTAERIEALARTHGLVPESTPFFYTVMPSPWLDGTDPSSTDALTDRLLGLSAGLCIIDNLGVVSGGADENSSEMIQVFMNFRRLAEFTGAAIVLVHHPRKPTGFKGRAGDTIRGHSSIEGALDLALLIEREEGSSQVTIKSTKTRDMDIPPFGAILSYESKPSSIELAKARFWGTLIQDMSPSATAQRAIIEILEEADEPLIQRELVGAVKAVEDIGTNQLRNVIGRMVKDGTLRMTPGSRNAQHYALADR